jgi:hypothetical protein
MSKGAIAGIIIFVILVLVGGGVGIYFATKPPTPSTVSTPSTTGGAAAPGSRSTTTTAPRTTKPRTTKPITPTTSASTFKPIYTNTSKTRCVSVTPDPKTSVVGIGSLLNPFGDPSNPNDIYLWQYIESPDKTYGTYGAFVNKSNNLAITIGSTGAPQLDTINTSSIKDSQLWSINTTDNTIRPKSNTANSLKTVMTFILVVPVDPTNPPVFIY